MNWDAMTPDVREAILRRAELNPLYAKQNWVKLPTQIQRSLLRCWDSIGKVPARKIAS